MNKTIKTSIVTLACLVGTLAVAMQPAQKPTELKLVAETVVLAKGVTFTQNPESPKHVGLHKKITVSTVKDRLAKNKIVKFICNDKTITVTDKTIDAASKADAELAPFVAFLQSVGCK